MAAYIAQQGYDCAHYLQSTGLDATTIATSCANIDLSQLSNVTFMVDAVWYKDPAFFQDLTGLNSTNTDIIFNLTDPTSFAGNLLTQQTLVYTTYGCTGANNNCTVEELA